MRLLLVGLLLLVACGRSTSLTGDVGIAAGNAYLIRSNLHAGAEVIFTFTTVVLSDNYTTCLDLEEGWKKPGASGVLLHFYRLTSEPQMIEPARYQVRPPQLDQGKMKAPHGAGVIAQAYNLSDPACENTLGGEADIFGQEGEVTLESADLLSVDIDFAGKFWIGFPHGTLEGTFRASACDDLTTGMFSVIDANPSGCRDLLPQGCLTGAGCLANQICNPSSRLCEEALSCYGGGSQCRSFQAGYCQDEGASTQCEQHCGASFPANSAVACPQGKTCTDLMQSSTCTAGNNGCHVCR